MKGNPVEMLKRRCCFCMFFVRNRRRYRLYILGGVSGELQASCFFLFCIRAILVRLRGF